jgi:tetratricopeptide (TPR) repeat protein
MNEERKLVPFARVRRRPDRNRMAEFAATARKLQLERSRAADLVSDALASGSNDLASRPELRNVGVVEQLGREVESRLDRAPREALAIAKLATAVADALPADGYPQVMLAQVRAHAWKDLGQALCYLARHEEALAALDRAERMLDVFATLAHDLAIVRYVRATTLAETGRFDDSRLLLSDCAHVFRAHGDARRELLCGIAQGSLLHRLKRFREARDAYLSLVGIAQDLQDLTAEAYLHHDIGYTSADLGDFVATEQHLNHAVEIFRRLNQPLNAARSEVVRGVMFARRGENRRAIAHIKNVRTTFLAHGLVEEAGIFGLEIVQAHLALHETREAETLAREIVADFTAAKLNDRAICALGYLTQAIAQRTASAETVGGVREYIVSLRRNPEREFVACA